MSTHLSDEQSRRLLGGTLPDDELLQADAHLWQCPDCRDALRRRTEPTPDLPPLAAPRYEGAAPQSALPAVPGYEILGELGRGGMAVVYQARQLRPNRVVALKVLQTGLPADARRRFGAESETLARLRHPGIVQVYEAGEHDDRPYFSLEFCGGGSLARKLAGAPMEPRQAAALVEAVARAVGAAHRAGIVHRDLKPANILLHPVHHKGVEDTESNEQEALHFGLGADLDRSVLSSVRLWGESVVPKITDFGLAKLLTSDTAEPARSGAVLGTPGYAAPEQLNGAAGPAADVYSLGAILYECLTGRPPFQAATVFEMLELARSCEPVAPHQLRPGVPPDLETICLKSLEKEAARRYASAEALADDLQRWLDGFPIRARPVSKLEHASRWCRRRPAFASLLAVLALTVASSLVGLFSLWRRSETERSRAESALERSIASDQATSGAVRELVGLLGMTVDAPQTLASERVHTASRVVRDLTAKVRQDRGFAASNRVAICDLESLLADYLQRRGDYDESRALLADSLELLDARRRDADDPDVDHAYARALMQLGWIARDQERYDEMLVLFQRAENALKGLVHAPRNLDVILSIDESRRAIAWLLDRSGLEEQRRRLLESHSRMLEQLGEQPGGDPAIGLLAVLARLDLAPAKCGAQSSESRFTALPPINASRNGSSGGWRTGSPKTSSPIRPMRSPPANPRAALTRTPKPMRLSWRSNQDAKRWAFTPPCFPPRHCRLPGLPSVGPRNNEGLAAWKTPAGPSQVSPPSQRCWPKEIPRRRCTTCYFAKPSSRNRNTPGKSTITPRSKTPCERDWAKLVPHYVSIPGTPTREFWSRVSRTN